MSIEEIPASDLRAGDQIVLRVDQVLADGDKVELVGVEAGPFHKSQKVRRVRVRPAGDAMLLAGLCCCSVGVTSAECPVHG